MTDEMFLLLHQVLRLDRYAETPGLGLFRDIEGPWLRREDVLQLIDGLDVLREPAARLEPKGRGKA
jgi:hypothetical protein